MHAAQDSQVGIVKRLISASADANHENPVSQFVSLYAIQNTAEVLAKNKNRTNNTSSSTERLQCATAGRTCCGRKAPFGCRR